MLINQWLNEQRRHGIFFYNKIWLQCLPELLHGRETIIAINRHSTLDSICNMLWYLCYNVVNWLQGIFMFATKLGHSVKRINGHTAR